MTDNSARKSGIVATDLRRPASMIWPSGPVSDPGEDWAALREAARPKAGGDIFAEVDAALNAPQEPCLPNPGGIILYTVERGESVGEAANRALKAAMEAKS